MEFYRNEGKRKSPEEEVCMGRKENGAKRYKWPEVAEMKKNDFYIVFK